MATNNNPNYIVIQTKDRNASVDPQASYEESSMPAGGDAQRGPSFQVNSQSSRISVGMDKPTGHPNDNKNASQSSQGNPQVQQPQQQAPEVARLVQSLRRVPNPGGSQHSPTMQYQQQSSVLSRVAFENRVTGIGATAADFDEGYDSSLFNQSQTYNNMREIDIDIEVGGFVSNLSQSTTHNVKLPMIGSSPAKQPFQYPEGSNQYTRTRRNMPTTVQNSLDLSSSSPLNTKHSRKNFPQEPTTSTIRKQQQMQQSRRHRNAGKLYQSLNNPRHENSDETQKVIQGLDQLNQQFLQFEKKHGLQKYKQQQMVLTSKNSKDFSKHKLFDKTMLETPNKQPLLMTQDRSKAKLPSLNSKLGFGKRVTQQDRMAASIKTTNQRGLPTYGRQFTMHSEEKGMQVYDQSVQDFKSIEDTIGGTDSKKTMSKAQLYNSIRDFQNSKLTKDAASNSRVMLVQEHSEQVGILSQKFKAAKMNDFRGTDKPFPFARGSEENMSMIQRSNKSDLEGFMPMSFDLQGLISQNNLKHKSVYWTKHANIVQEQKDPRNFESSSALKAMANSGFFEKKRRQRNHNVCQSLDQTLSLLQHKDERRQRGEIWGSVNPSSLRGGNASMVPTQRAGPGGSILKKTQIEASSGSGAGGVALPNIQQKLSQEYSFALNGSAIFEKNRVNPPPHNLVINQTETTADAPNMESPRGQAEGKMSPLAVPEAVQAGTTTQYPEVKDKVQILDVARYHEQLREDDSLNREHSKSKLDTIEQSLVETTNDKNSTAYNLKSQLAVNPATTQSQEPLEALHSGSVRLEGVATSKLKGPMNRTLFSSSHDTQLVWKEQEEAPSPVKNLGISPGKNDGTFAIGESHPSIFLGEQELVRKIKKMANIQLGIKSRKKGNLPETFITSAAVAQHDSPEKKQQMNQEISSNLLKERNDDELVRRIIEEDFAEAALIRQRECEVLSIVNNYEPSEIFDDDSELGSQLGQPNRVFQVIIPREKEHSSYSSDSFDTDSDLDDEDTEVAAANKKMGKQGSTRNLLKKQPSIKGKGLDLKNILQQVQTNQKKQPRPSAKVSGIGIGLLDNIQDKKPPPKRRSSTLQPDLIPDRQRRQSLFQKSRPTQEDLKNIKIQKKGSFKYDEDALAPPSNPSGLSSRNSSGMDNYHRMEGHLYDKEREKKQHQETMLALARLQTNDRMKEMHRVTGPAGVGAHMASFGLNSGAQGGGPPLMKRMTVMMKMPQESSLRIVPADSDVLEIKGMQNMIDITRKELEPNFDPNFDQKQNSKRVKGMRKKFNNKNFQVKHAEDAEDYFVFKQFKRSILRKASPNRRISQIMEADNSNRQNHLDEITVKNQLLETYLKEHQKEAGQELPPTAEEREKKMARLMELAALESGDLEFFTYKATSDEFIDTVLTFVDKVDLFSGQVEDKKFEEAQSQLDVRKFKENITNQYVKYLTQGKLPNQIVFNFAKSLKRNLGPDLISRFNMKSISLVDSLVQEVLDRIKFKDMCTSQSTNVSVPGTEMGGIIKELTEFNPKKNLKRIVAESNGKVSNEVLGTSSYISASILHGQFVLPILHKIFHKSLILKNYHMNSGSSHALREAFLTNPQLINSLFIDNCNLSDSDLALILEGTINLQQLQSLSLKSTEVGMACMRQIEGILNRTYPSQLLELRIVSCKLSSTFQTELLRVLESGYSTLHTLNLVKIGMTKETLQLLCNFLELHNQYIRNLDISSNEMPSPFSYRNFLKILSGLKDDDEGEEAPSGDSSYLTLETLCLSSNCLFDQNKRYYERDLKKGKKEKIDYQEEVIRYLSTFLVKNQALIHFDLISTGLTQEIMYELMAYIKVSPSLVAVHLSNNPGVTEKAKVKYALILGAKQSTRTEHVLHFKEEQKNPLLHEDQAEDQVFYQTLSTQNREQVQARRIQREKDILKSTNLVQGGSTISQNLGEDAMSSQTFLLYRYLGHDREFKEKASQWRLNTNSDKECWVCDRHIYSVLFWNEAIGNLQNTEIVDKKTILKFIKAQNKQFLRNMRKGSKRALQLLQQESSKYRLQKQTSEDSPQHDFLDRPIIYSSSNGWIGRELHTLSEFCFLIDQRKTARLNKLSFENIQNYEFYHQLHQEGRATTPNLDQDLLEQLEFYKEGFTFRDVIHKNLQYRDPQFINSSTLCMHLILDRKSNPVTWVIPQFIRAGKYNYVIKYRGKYYFHKAVIHYRQEQIPLRSQDFEARLETEESADDQDFFIKSNSIFADWREDTEPKMKQCLEHDQRYMRCEMFVKKEEDVAACKQFVQENFSSLKAAYTIALSRSKQIQGIDNDSCEEFFITDCKVDQHITHDCVKQHVAKTLKNFGGGGNEATRRESQKDPKLLCRKEFIEVFMRLAQDEYSDQSFTEAATRMLRKVMFFVDKHNNWQSFRDDMLWTKECHNLFQTNKEALQQVFDKYCMGGSYTGTGSPVSPSRSPKKRTQMMSFNDLKQLFMNDSVPPVCTNIIVLIQSCVMSKMTVVKDFEAPGQAFKMHQFDFVEFLEVIGRIAQTQSIGTHQENVLLHKKIEAILRQIIATVGGTTKVKKHVDVVKVNVQKSEEIEQELLAKRETLKEGEEDSKNATNEATDDDLFYGTEEIDTLLDTPLSTPPSELEDPSGASRKLNLKIGIKKGSVSKGQGGGLSSTREVPELVISEVDENYEIDD